MPFETPTLDGIAIFGAAVKMRMVLRPSVNHIQEFFGINGCAATFGGKRGRHIFVEGILTAGDVPSLNLAEGTFETFVDGGTHFLVDTRGREWDSVLFEGDFQPEEGPIRQVAGVFNPDGSPWYGFAYRAAFLALV